MQGNISLVCNMILLHREDANVQWRKEKTVVDLPLEEHTLLMIVRVLAAHKIGLYLSDTF